MTTNILAAALARPDVELLAHIGAAARTERDAVADLVADLAALELRPSLYAAQGYGSLFDYCTHVLRLSEDAACARIRVARTCRRFPVIVDLLSSGALSLTTVRLLQPHLTVENHEVVLARAANRRHEEIQALVAELAPQPDVPSSLRKLPAATKQTAAASLAASLTLGWVDGGQSSAPALPGTSGGRNEAGPQTASGATMAAGSSSPALIPPSFVSAAFASPRVLSSRRPILKPLAPERYRVQFTIGQQTHKKVRRLQALLRREIPNGDLAVIFDQAVDLMLEKVERAKLGAKARTRNGSGARRADGAYENRIRFKTDESVGDEGGNDAGRPARNGQTTLARPGAPSDRDRQRQTERRHGPSRHILNPVKRAVWRRDGSQCGFVSADGRRCTERSFLELHHLQPHALDGPSTVGNIALRCRRHNIYEAEQVFGPREPVVDSSRSLAGGQEGRRPGGGG